MPNPASTYRVDSEPAGKCVEVVPDTTLLAAAQRAEVGNAALVCAWWALVSRQVRARAQRIAAAAKYLELTTYPEFQRRFTMGMLFPSIKEEAKA